MTDAFGVMKWYTAIYIKRIYKKSLFAGVTIPLYLIIIAIYNVLFHPLRHYPGPLIARVNQIWWAYHSWNGNIVYKIAELHKQYGDIVRIAPGELSYIDSQAWSDIFGHRSSDGRGNLPKDLRYNKREPNGVPSIITSNEDDHRRMRRLQAHMFSEKALAAQEPLITGHVDKMISKLHEKAGDPATATVDIVKWYNYTTFDILGDLAFGESFGCLDADILHPWIINIYRSIKDISYYRVARTFPSPLFELLLAAAPKETRGARKEEFAFAARKALSRIEQGSTDRVDFMSYILKYNDEKGMTVPEIQSNAAILITAGSETTATFLSGITYNLLLNPPILQKLTDLIRTTFTHDSEININTITHLEYFTACLEESFRTYPPVPVGLRRRTTAEGNIICDRYVPPATTVTVGQWAAYQSPRNFTDPEKFVPERWLKDPPVRYADDCRKVVQQFSVGPRNCIGRNLAYAEMRLILAKMLWGFDWELQPESRNWSRQKVFTLWQKPSLRVKLTSRKM